VTRDGNHIIAVTSGKGGTGKTTVAVNLALTWRAQNRRVRLLDCDVEAPNAHIFLKPDIAATEIVATQVPVVDESLCDGCGRCGEVCRFSAIVSLGARALVFPELCHGCGGCALVCPQKAISETAREIGVIEKGGARDIEFMRGKLNIGEAMSPPLIRALKRQDSFDGVTILDSPPGTSCPVIQSVRGSDYVLIVTEPTPFGLNDLALAVDMVRAPGLPCGVIINRMGIGDDRVQRYCLENDVKIIGTIPDDRRAAEAYSRGQALVDALPEYRDAFGRIAQRLEDILDKQAIGAL
jgi:MinD superfamily P-loop ATPase